MKHRVAVSIALTLSVFLAAAKAGGEEPVPKNLRSAIESANGAFPEQMKTGDAAGIAAAYEDDGVFVGIDGSSSRGKAEIERRMRERFEKLGLASSTAIHSRRLVMDGDLAFEWGDGAMTFAGNSGPTTSRGRFLTVWRRQPDGSWKIHRNVVLP